MSTAEQHTICQMCGEHDSAAYHAASGVHYCTECLQPECITFEDEE